MFAQIVILITSAFMSSTLAADCGRREFCSPDKDETWYCCGFRHHQCCYHENDTENDTKHARPVTDFWWFWFLLFLMLVLTVAMVACLCVRYPHCLRGYHTVPGESRSVTVQVLKPSTNVLSNYGHHNHGHSSNPVTASAPPLHDQPPHGHPPLHGQPPHRQPPPEHGEPPPLYDQPLPVHGQPPLPHYQTISLIETQIA